MMTTPDSKNPPPESIIVDNNTDEVSCDGGHGSLGHPIVWYSFNEQDSVECLYCDRLFIKERAAGKEQRKKSA